MAGEEASSWLSRGINHALIDAIVNHRSNMRPASRALGRQSHASRQGMMGRTAGCAGSGLTVNRSQMAGEKASSWPSMGINHALMDATVNLRSNMRLASC